MKQQQITTSKKRTVTKEALLKAMDDSYGNISFIAKKLGVYRSTVYDNISKYNLKDLLVSEREKMIDLAESKLIDNVRAGKEISILFLLKTLGKKRGYVEKRELEVYENIEEKIKKMTPEQREYRIEALKNKLLSIKEVSR